MSFRPRCRLAPPRLPRDEVAEARRGKAGERHQPGQVRLRQLSEEDGKYTYLGDVTDRIRQREFGLFAQDTWRARPNLTLTAGLRYEVQFPFTALNDVYSFIPFEQIFGVSGPGNLFRPGVLQGSPPRFNQFRPGDRAFETDWNNFADVGLAWSPDGATGARGSSARRPQRPARRLLDAFVREGTNT